MRKISLLFAVMFALLISAFGCAHYSRGPWAGKVIDAETKQPIEGAGIFAMWEEDYAAGIVPGTSVVDAVEMLTDKEGNFKIPAKSYFAIRPHGEIYGPDLKIFKPGYKYYKYAERGFVADDNKLHDYPKEWKGLFYKPDAIVELKKLETRKERIENQRGAMPDTENFYKFKLYMNLINIELKDLGLPVYPEQ